MEIESSGGQAILIVEDSPTQAEELKYILENNNYQVLIASNGREAIDLMKKCIPAIIISDIVMPLVDGYQLCKYIKSDEKLKNIPVILMTSLSDPAEVLKGMECGADNFMTKPYDEKILVSRLKYLLKNRNLRENDMAQRQQILDFLFSTYETAVEKNIELTRVKDELREMNDRLEEIVDERTSALHAEIEEHKQTDFALKESEERFRTIFENAPDAIFLADPETGIIIDANSRASELIERPHEEIIGMHQSQLHPLRNKEYTRETFKEHTRKNDQKGRIRPIENIVVRPDGTEVPVEVLGQIVTIKGRSVLQGVFRDISERKRAEDALRESKALVDAVIENVPLMIFLKEATDLRFVIFNKAGEELLGYDRKDLLGKKNLDLFLPEQAAYFMARDGEVLAGESGILDIPEEPIMTAGKGERLLHTRKVCIRGADGSTKYLLGISEDITERKKAEEKIKQHEVHLMDLLVLHRLGNNTETEVLDFTLEASLRSLHSEFAFIGIMSANEAVITIHKSSIGSMKQCAIMDKLIEYPIEKAGLWGEAVRQRCPIIINDYKTSKLFKKGCPEGHVPIKRFLSIPIFSGKRIVAIAAVANKASEYTESDVTSFTSFLNEMWGILDYQVTREEIKKSLEEKEVLLREIHHRVKNNMQIVISLLNLQSQSIEDKKYKEIFIGSQSRIHAMALIHEKLYQSENLAQINIKEYIEEIVTNIFESYGQKSNIKFEINVENIPINIDYAVPCGLIVNELLTNSFKYAFPDGRKGIIKISAKTNDNKMIQLSISDDGIGIAEDLDIRNTESLGLKLVTSLAESQLHGQIILNREKGTEFQINFSQAK